MAHKIECTLCPELISEPVNLKTRIFAWLKALKKNLARKDQLIHLLSYDDKWLEDMGLTRVQLVAELGYDPRELPSLVGVGEQLYLQQFRRAEQKRAPGSRYS